MSKKKDIKHVIPHIGLTTISLYSPANKLYDLLTKQKEIKRLKTLRHLGALSHALPGARQSRWDYTVSMLYYANVLDVHGMKSSFKLGNIEFSSPQAALQTLALCWNIGHLPGTFPVEKGVYWWIYEVKKSSPASVLKWPTVQYPQVKRTQTEASRLLEEQDYIGISRVLAVIKLISMLDRADSEFFCSLVFDFAAPFLLSYEPDNSKQWAKLRQAFSIIRHLAYLTLDISLSGMEWCPSIPSLLRQEINREGTNLQEISDRIGEVLSPIERMVYNLLYHRETARKEMVIVANWVYSELKRLNDRAPSQIAEWLEKGLFRELKIKKHKPSSNSAVIIGTIRLRTHFAGAEPPVEIESLLRQKKFSYPLALKYKAWNSEIIVEPDELLIDCITTKKNAKADEIGRLLAWMIWQFETPNVTPDDTFELLCKADFEKTYISLLKRAFELAFPGKTLNIESWPLARLGLFPENPPESSSGCIWACNGKLEDPITKHIVRNRSKHISSEMKDRYAELMGIHELRKFLKSKWRAKNLRQRCLIITASIHVQENGNDLMEFDGGIVVISSRGGRITWYGLESKRGKGDPYHSLEERLKKIELPANIHRLSSRYAFATLILK